jgi:hypothetical protein
VSAGILSRASVGTPSATDLFQDSVTSSVTTRSR